MTDKRSPHPDGFRSQKRAKTFPLTKDDGTDERDDTRSQDGVDSIIDHQPAVVTLQKGTTDSQASASEDLKEVKEGDSSSPLESRASLNAPESPTEEVGHDLASAQSDLSGSEDHQRAEEDASLGVEETTTSDKDPDILSPARRDSESPAASSPSYHVVDDRFDDDYYDDASDRGSADDDDVDLVKELGPWSAPPEPLRPRNPYGKGQRLSIRKHTACPPFGQGYASYPGLREYANERDLRTKTLVELCLEHPPMEGKTAWKDASRSLQILDVIRAKDDGGAQLVVCRLDDEPEEYVAKIYDPLYYGFSDRMWTDQPRDVTYEADQDYCREVVAYLELDDEFGGKTTPKYHGSWTFQMTLGLPDGQKTRDIRMILMEQIQGRTMLDVKPDSFPEAVCLETVAQIIESLSRISFAGVRHRDISQRNIMLCEGEGTNTIDRVVIIDFNFAVVDRYDIFEAKYGALAEKEDKPQNPAELWWDGGFLYGGFGEWFPRSWEYRLRPLQEWLYERWGKSQEFKAPKKPLDWDEDNVPQRYVEF